MDAFESLVATLLCRDGYWVWPSFKVDLTKAEKRRIGRHSTPRWEIDLVAYKGSTNEVLAVECKSFLDSTGVVFRRGRFERERRYKLFMDQALRRVVLKGLARALRRDGLVRANPRVVLCLAAGKIARKSDRTGLDRHFRRRGWRLFDSTWAHDGLRRASVGRYENDIAHVVAKILLRARVERGDVDQEKHAWTR